MKKGRDDGMMYIYVSTANALFINCTNYNLSII
jgi:hypothetical protein